MSTIHLHHGRLRRTTARPGSLLALPLIVIGALIATATGFVLYVLWPQWPEPPLGPQAPALPITVAGVAFNVPPAAIRVPIQRQPGAQERIDLAFLWPSLEPPDPASSAITPTKGATKPQPLERIFVTIVAARDSLPPDQRVKTIYPRYVEAEPVAGPEGLAVVPFRQGTPYQGEDLVHDAEAPGNFLVRCSRSSGPTPGICLHVRRIDTADVTIRFPRDWLDDWRTVAASIERLIASLRPPHG